MRGLDILGAFEEVIGYFDIKTKQNEMDALKKVPFTVSVARTMVATGLQTINKAIDVAETKKSYITGPLPGGTSRQNVMWKLKWHADELSKMSDMQAPYKHADDLRSWTMRAFIEANAADEGAFYLDAAWNEMISEIKKNIAELPAKARQIALDAASNILGVPKWAFGVGAAVLTVFVAFTGYKVAMSRWGSR